MIVLVGLFGLILGSFINVVVHRLPRGESLIHPGSHCPSCDTPVRPYDNIPLISYMLLGGRCRHCRGRIAWRYPAVEALTALLLASLYIRFGLSADFVRFSAMILFLIPISLIDIEKGLIKNALTIPGFIVGFILTLLFQIENWKFVLFNHLLLGAVGGGIGILLLGLLGNLLFKKESMGMGDVKILVFIGIYIGFPGNFISLFFGVLLASVIIITGLIFKKLKFGETIPFGPFIALGSLIFVLAGEVLIHWYLGFLTGSGR